MLDAEYLRKQAERCRKLARTVNRLEVVVELRRLAQEFEERADLIEADAAGA